MKKRLNTKARNAPKLHTNFHDLEGTQLNIHWNPTYKRFSIGITDSCGKGTNSIEMGYEDLRSLFNESEAIMIKNTNIIEEKSFPKPNMED